MTRTALSAKLDFEGRYAPHTRRPGSPEPEPVLYRLVWQDWSGWYRVDADTHVPEVRFSDFWTREECERARKKIKGRETFSRVMLIENPAFQHPQRRFGMSPF